MKIFASIYVLVIALACWRFGWLGLWALAVGPIALLGLWLLKMLLWWDILRDPWGKIDKPKVSTREQRR